MSAHRSPFVLGALAFAFAATLAACGGGVSGPANTPNVPAATPTPVPIPPGVNPQVVNLALPSSAMGSEVTGFGLIGGFTQQQYSQILGYPPGAQIMIRNSQAALPHTFGVVSTSAFDAGAALSLQATGGQTIQAGFNTGTISPTALAGPFTLVAGTFFIGCAYHYTSDTMRTVLIVAANATPGPQATPPSPTQTAPPSGGIY